MTIPQLIICTLICLMPISCMIGFSDGLPSPAPIEEPAPASRDREKEKRLQALLHTCTVNNVIQVQIPVCRTLAEHIRLEADKAELELAEAGL